MTDREIAFIRVQEKLSDGMIEGNMHGCLRDIGRLAGGFAAAGYLNGADLNQLEAVAVGMAKNKRQGQEKWREAVEYGKRQPVQIESYRNEARDRGHALDWEDTIGGGKNKTERRIVDQNWVQDAEIQAPLPDWEGNDLIRYLRALYQTDEIVAYVVESWKPADSERWVPNGRGVYTKTAGEMISEIQKHAGDLGAAIGDHNKEAGAWIRINPFNGQGVRDENVTEFRHALLESDNLPLAKQLAIIRELEVPCAAIVHSGGKSIHAIVKIEADSYEQFRKRVDFLYEVAKREGLQVDRQNRNPSRLSRMPGVARNGKPQYLIATAAGKASWQEWEDWVQEANDNLPDPEPLSATFDNLPPLADPLIAGVLRQGHKLLLAGPSKAGKSYDLIQLCVAIAEGTDWHGWLCTKGRVLYVNLELDRASCLHRFRDVYAARKTDPKNVGEIDIWNLRGKAVPLDQLAPRLIHRALKRRYSAVVIDPIYKIITGDENSADQMARFCNQFDRICDSLGTAVIYAHHHSKGSQGAKRAADRASGSGVFARDPDAMLDMIELEIGQDRRKQLENQAAVGGIEAFLDEHLPDWRFEVDQDDQVVAAKLCVKAQALLPGKSTYINRISTEARDRAGRMTGWRIEGTLREFAAFKPVRCWFDWPIHRHDDGDLLKDAKAAGEDPPWKADQKAKEDAKKSRKEDGNRAITTAVNACSDGENPPSVEDLASYLGSSERTVRRRLESHPEYTHKAGLVIKKPGQKE